MSKDKSDVQLDSFFEAELDRARGTVGDRRIMVGEDSDQYCYGLPIPSLAFQYVLQSDVLPFEKLIYMAGEPASNKSSFAFELARWVINAGGFARLNETERKFNPDLASALLGNVTDRQWQIRFCEKLEEWQTLLWDDVKLYRKFTESTGKRGKSSIPKFPACMIIDSLTGVTTEGGIDAVDKQEAGKLQAQGMRDANVISRWLQSINFTGLPWYVIFIRHEKANITESFGYGNRVRTPGGVANDYFASYDFRFKVIKRHRDQGTKYGYNLVEVKCHKNAFGINGLKFAIRMSWTAVDTGSEQGPVNVIKWEWDLATAQFLANFDKEDIKDICHVVDTGSVNNPIFSCRQLGLKEVTADDLCLALRQESTIFTALQNYLNIHRRKVFTLDNESTD